MIQHSNVPSTDTSTSRSTSLLIIELIKYSDIILDYVIPIVWILLVILLVDFNHIWDILYMPFLGLFAAFLANAIPIGGGVVYIPALMLIDGDVKLGVSFSLSVMTIGNGVFGFLRWLKKDDSLIIWESMPYTVGASSIGSIIGILLLPALDAAYIKVMFAIFCLLLAIFVLAAVYRGGVDKVVEAPVIANNENNVISVPSSSPLMKEYAWYKVTLVSFFAGLVLVPNIAIGPAMTTYLLLVLIGYNAKAAIVTGVITGGWACICPFILHLVVLKDVPITLWLLVLPGVYYGAMYAPLVHDRVGLDNILGCFALFLFATFVLFIFH